MELNKKGKKLQAEGVKYGDIEQHYKRSDYIDKKYWQRVTKPAIVRKFTLPGNIAIDPYTGEEFNPKDGVGAHVTSAGEAHQSMDPENQLTPKEKKLFGHNRANLVLALPKVNIEKGVHDIANWQPPKNIVPMAENIERNKKRFGLGADPKEFKKLTEILGRKPDLKIRPKLSSTLYCTSCHINHSINEHN